jgi:hypothetical protein
MKQVPLSGRVIFCDWHGVLSRDPFWVSIRSSATHPLRRQLEAGMAGVFASDRDIANEWMKGLLSSDQVIAEMGIQLDRRFKEDFLARRLDIDCARMKVNAELFEVLRAMRAEAMVVVATDNMDCFARAFEHSRRRRRRAHGGRRSRTGRSSATTSSAPARPGRSRARNPRRSSGHGWQRTGWDSRTPYSSTTGRTTAPRSPAKAARPSSGRWAPTTSATPQASSSAG